MRSATRVVAALAIGATLAVAACSDAALDSTVVMDHVVIPAQPWVASGDLVDAGLVCSSGDRHSVAMWHPDGSPMTMMEFAGLADKADRSGLDVWHVRRVTEREYLCDDGTGAFTLREDATGPTNRATAEVVGGTGAYAGMTGSCVIDLSLDENRQTVDMVTTCELDLGTTE